MTFDDIVSGLLRSSETLLWSYGFDSMDIKNKSIFGKYLPLFRFFWVIIWVIIWGIIAYFSYARGSFANFDRYAVITLIFGFGGLLLDRLLLGWLASKFRKFNKSFVPNYPVYQNAFVTDQRLVFFKHYNDEWLSLTQDEIESVSLDYARGARAIKVMPINGGEHYLIGPQDFVAPVNLIRAKFLDQAAAG